MEKFMESKFMQGLMIVAAKIGAQKHLVAIRDGFIAMMPIVIAGSLAVVINNLPINSQGEGLRTILEKNPITTQIVTLDGNIWFSAIKCMSLFLVVGVGYSLAKAYEQDAIAGGLIALCVFCACLPQSATGITTTDETVAPALIQEIQKGNIPDGYTVEEQKGQVETIDGVSEKITAYVLTKVDENGVPIGGDTPTNQEIITVNYNNDYQLDEKGHRVLKDGKDGQFIILNTNITYSHTKETSAYGNISYNVTDSNGLFAGLILALITVELFCRLAMSGKITIKMPEAVPPAVAKSFASLFPGLISIFGVTLVVQVIVHLSPYSDFFALIRDLVSEPLQGISEGYGAALAIGCLTTFFWFFGLHGANIVESVFGPISLQKLSENTDRVNNGLDPENIVTLGFFNTYIWLGGSGCTLALLFAIYLGSKSKAQRAVASLAIVPGIFEINEPVIFGLPIVLNAAYFIPFILVPFTLVTITYFATVAGICPVVGIIVPWTFPPIISGFVATSSVMGCVFQIINLVVATIIYFPFVKIADKMEEKAQQA